MSKLVEDTSGVFHCFCLFVSFRTSLMTKDLLLLNSFILITIVGHLVNPRGYFITL